MRTLIYGSLASLMIVTVAHAKEPQIEVVDPLIDSIFRSLARRQGFNLLAAPEGNAVEIGKVYYVTEPECSSDLTGMAKTGAPTQLFLAWELPKPPSVEPVRGWTSIRLASVIDKGLRADMYARLPDRQAEVDIAFEALERTNAQILFATRQASSIRVKRLMDSEFKALGVRSPSQIGNDALGAVAPHAELIVQKFEFDKNATKQKRAGLLAAFMALFGARLAAQSDVTEKYGFKQATYSTMAFKPVTSLFACTKRPSNG